MNWKTLAAAAMLTPLVNGPVWAQGDPAAGYHWPEAPWHTTRLAPSIHMIVGGGGNSVIMVGTHNVVVFDAKTTAKTGRQDVERIARVTSKPINVVILSHSDVDHVGGLRSFPKGIKIIGHANALAELNTDLAQNPGRALPAQYFPNDIVTKTRESVNIDGFTMDLLHWAPAHTSGDLLVYLPAQRLLLCGDIVTQNRDHPLIHLEKHGSSKGWIETMQALLKLNVDRYVPGHGEVMTRAQLEKMLKDAQSERDTIKSLVAQGKSLKEIEIATGDPGPAEVGGPPFAPFAEVVYDELTKTAE